MNHRSTTAAASMGVAVAVLFGAPACAHAEPQQPRPVTTPQPDAPCSENLAGTMARLADGKTNLVCRGQGDDSRWMVWTSPYPLSDRWLTYGPELQLHGQGMRNPEIMSGLWTGYPQVSDGVCRAEQVAVVGAGKVSPPESVTGEPGKQLEFSVSPTLFTIKLSGNCLWQKV
jgi:hypothetical protein